MKLTFGFSPCPNDTFMFDAIYNKRIDLHGLEIECILEDVEYLNKAALLAELDVTKISFNALTLLTDRYQLLESGSALGRNCGPLLISKLPFKEIDMANATIAIPGKNTTANFLLSFAYPNTQNKVEALFSDIEEMVLTDKVDLGLIIHENRFTYMEKGLHKILDLGEFWEAQTGLPIPLGGISVRRSLPLEIKSLVNQIITDSVDYAFKHRTESDNFVAEYAQEMSPAVRAAHINLYVNDFSLRINEEGKSAVYALFRAIKGPEVVLDDIFL